MAGMLREAASGDNTTSHVVMTGSAGVAVAVVAQWVLSLWHIDVPADVMAAMTVLFGIISSVVAQKLS